MTTGFFKSLPNAHFAKTGIYRYRLKSNSYLLYSLGPDCRDDGAKPIKDVKPYKGAAWLQLESEGDIVVGVNPI